MTALEVRAYGSSKFGVLFTASLVSSLIVLDSEKPAAQRVLRAAGGTAPSERRLKVPPSESLLGYDQVGCFCAAWPAIFKAASRASLSARNRAVFSRVAARAASYSATACCPSRSCCSFFLNAASARSRALVASVSNLVTPARANPRAGQTFLPEERMPSMWDAQQANAVAGYLFHAQPGRGAGFVWTLPAFPERVARMERSGLSPFQTLPLRSA